MLQQVQEKLIDDTGGALETLEADGGDLHVTPNLLVDELVHEVVRPAHLSLAVEDLHAVHVDVALERLILAL